MSLWSYTNVVCSGSEMRNFTISSYQHQLSVLCMQADKLMLQNAEGWICWSYSFHASQTTILVRSPTTVKMSFQNYFSEFLADRLAFKQKRNNNIMTIGIPKRNKIKK